MIFKNLLHAATAGVETIKGGYKLSRSLTADCSIAHTYLSLIYWSPQNTDMCAENPVGYLAILQDCCLNLWDDSEYKSFYQTNDFINDTWYNTGYWYENSDCEGAYTEIVHAPPSCSNYLSSSLTQRPKVPKSMTDFFSITSVIIICTSIVVVLD
jgi:hypothetical protein